MTTVSNTAGAGTGGLVLSNKETGRISTNRSDEAQGDINEEEEEVGIGGGKVILLDLLRGSDLC